ncbi:hypothetical protein [Coleofasciculus sp. E2-BRE-01]|uniref:hypothetical protein n=1 Tax=Coleofasciculus sp. E2-BRE-01 TaxID=3069524 RepID=UPI0033045DE1
MNKLLFISIITCGIISSTPAAWADSPLTSTDFASTYQDVDSVRYASDYGLDERVFEALSNPNVPHDVRVAIINQIGWSGESQQNAKLYLEYIAARDRTTPSELTLALLTSQETVALGYLLAMDHRFSLGKPIGGFGEVEQADALTLLNAAVAKVPNDFSVALIRSLVQGQDDFRSGNWCAVYQGVSSVVYDFPTPRNMRYLAIKEIMNYIGLYQDYCISAPNN